MKTLTKPARKSKAKTARAPQATDAPPKTVLVLRTCAPDLTSSHQRRTKDGDKKSAKPFRWPESGPVACDDWTPDKECGGGLHGLLWGEGDGSLLNWDPEAKWLVVSVAESDIVDLVGKVKFPRGDVVFCGDRQTATAYLLQNGAHGRAIVGGTATAGYRGTATAGYRGTATAGDSGTATAGYSGTATAGDSGTATAGYSGTATAGDSGTATAGDSGIIVCRWWDDVANRYRLAVGYPGENGIKPGVKYRANDKGELVEVEKP